jgi:hypothetical protein
MKRIVIAALGGPLLALSAAAGVLAATPPGTVTVETNGCDFTVHIALDQAWPVVAWEVKVFADDWKDGKTVLSDQALDDADGKIDAGPYTLPEGHYTVAVDNEPVDSSAIVEDFTLSCPAVVPTPTPTGNEHPVTSTPTPKATGHELPATGGGGVNRTPPPTDTGMAASDGGSTGLPLIAMSVLGIAAAIAWYTRRTLAAARVVRRR